MGLVSTNLKRVMEAFFKKEFIMYQLKRWRDYPEIPKRHFFLFYFWVKNNIWDCPLNPTHGETLDIKGCRLAQWYRVGSVTNSERMLWFENILFSL